MFYTYCLITSNSFGKNDFTNNLIAKYQIHSVDTHIYNINPITIAQIRNLKKNLHIKPFASAYKLALINGNFLTSEAQQALLKTLEEPPDNSFIIIYAANQDLLLPTIISRCKIAKEEININLVSEEIIKYENFWNKIIQTHPIERLKETAELTISKDELKNWLIKQIIFFRKKLIDNYFHPKNQEISIRKNWQIIKQLIKSQELINYNINLKLVIDQMFLNI